MSEKERGRVGCSSSLECLNATYLRCLPTLCQPCAAKPLKSSFMLIGPCFFGGLVLALQEEHCPEELRTPGEFYFRMMYLSLYITLRASCLSITPVLFPWKQHPHSLILFFSSSAVACYPPHCVNKPLFSHSFRRTKPSLATSYELRLRVR